MTVEKTVEIIFVNTRKLLLNSHLKLEFKDLIFKISVNPTSLDKCISMNNLFQKLKVKSVDLVEPCKDKNILLI